MHNLGKYVPKINKAGSRPPYLLHQALRPIGLSCLLSIFCACTQSSSVLVAAGSMQGVKETTPLQNDPKQAQDGQKPISEDLLSWREVMEGIAYQSACLGNIFNSFPLLTATIIALLFAHFLHTEGRERAFSRWLFAFDRENKLNLLAQTDKVQKTDLKRNSPSPFKMDPHKKGPEAKDLTEPLQQVESDEKLPTTSERLAKYMIRRLHERLLRS